MISDIQDLGEAASYQTVESKQRDIEKITIQEYYRQKHGIDLR